jgi:hypothetical protein
MWVFLRASRANPLPTRTATECSRVIDATTTSSSLWMTYGGAR